MARFFDFFNAPIAGLVVLFVAVVNALLYLSVPEAPPEAPYERGGPQMTRVETTTVERTERPVGDREAAPQPAPALQSTTSTQPSAAASASATVSP
jgi:hypothetical protein